MTEVIDLVVHFDTLEEHAAEGDLEARSVLSLITPLLNKPATLRVKENPFVLPDGLPNQSEVILKISGAYLRQCCVKTLYSARKAGYEAELNTQSCFDNGYKMPPAYEPKDLLEVVPEYAHM